MPVNKNALIRYRTIDQCLQNRSRKWTLADLIDACSDALYELEGKDTYVSKRTVQLDIQLLRSDKLGYSAPIEVYERRYYRYAAPEYKITDVPLTGTDLNVLTESVTMLRQFKDFSLFQELNGVIQKLEDKIYRASDQLAPIIHLDKNDQLTGLRHLDTLYQAISKRIVLKVQYQSFIARQQNEIHFHPFILKEYNNRWFLIGRKHEQATILTLALDRIQAIGLDLKTEYLQENFDALDYYKDSIGVTVINRPPVPLELWASKKNLPYLLTKPIHSSQQLVEKRPDGSGILHLSVKHNFELERLLLGFGAGIVVLKPRSIRNRMKKELKSALESYSKGA